MRSKLAMLAVAIVAIAAVVGLDAMKRELRDTREKKYSAKLVAEQLKGNALLAVPAERAAKKNDRYATADDVFNAILAETSHAKKLAEARTAIRDAYAVRIAANYQEIRGALTAGPATDKDAAKDAFDLLKANRAELIAARTAELTEAEQIAAAYVANLRRELDDSNVAETAKSAFRVSKNESLNNFAKRIADPDHPLSILYDVLWYASLVLGVLSLVALLLTPLFRTLPVLGADETFMNQIRGIFGRLPSSIGAGIARVAAMTIGTAAIVSVAATAPSSPLHESGLLPPRIEREESVKTGTQTTTTTAEPRHGEEKKADEDVRKEPEPDARVDTLIADVEQLKSDNQAHRNVFASHQESLEKLEPLPVRVATLAEEEQAQREQLETSFGAIHTRIGGVDERAESAGLKADFAEKKAVEVSQQVDQAGKRIAESAAAIEAGVDLPLKVGERPAVLRSLLGFDRYRVTEASVSYVRRAGAPEEIIAAVRAMAGDAVMSNDALRLDLRQLVCGSATNCKVYVEWRGTVLRAARLQ
ncbi:MAG: hypothetical protein M3P06_16595 [Acidobacteriota bacterium]|nr:hypothetical protein [Acidobacteriota bacterium]